MLVVTQTLRQILQDIRSLVQIKVIVDRQSRDSMSAETGPVAHKPLSRAPLCQLRPGRSASEPELLVPRPPYVFRIGESSKEGRKNLRRATRVPLAHAVVGWQGERA